MKRILFLDDAPHCHAAFETCVRQLGEYEVVSFYNGLELLPYYEKTFQEHPFDYIFVDITMPHINGVDTVEKLVGINPKAKISIMGYAPSAHVLHAVKLGATCFTQKPLKEEDILMAFSKMDEKTHT